MQAALQKNPASFFQDGGSFMTPDIIRYGVAGRYAYELSRGNGFGDYYIYGITIVDRETGENSHELSKCVFSMDEAVAHIAALRRQP